jgi:hypothetical protein
MATRTWTGTTGNWEDQANWDNGLIGSAPKAGDMVILPSRGASYVVSLSSATPILGSVTIGDFNHTSPITLQLNAGADLHTTGAIDIALYAVVEGQGALEADGGFGVIFAGSGAASILAGTATSGGVLDVTGQIDYNIYLGFANSAHNTTLKLESVQHSQLNTFSITSGTQTLELGAGASVSFANAISVSAGTVQLDGATLAASNGVLLSNGAQFMGSGTLQGNISGAGSVFTAVGGTLTLTQAVGNIPSGVTNLVLANGSSLLLTSSYGIGGFGVGHPTLTFQGTGDIFQAVNESIYNIYIGTISGFAGGDYIKLGSFGPGDLLTYNASAHTITISDSGGYNIKTFTFSPSTDVSRIKLTQEDVAGVLADVLTICFMPGTMIATSEGEAPVETLQRGDLVLTAEGEARPVLWVGRQTIAARFVDPVRNWPIRIAAGALAENVPSRDLLVSPEHALLVEDVLVNAGALVNGTSIRRESAVAETFVYCHVELEDHSLILAENVPAETFVDNVDRRHFDNWAEHDALYPEGRAVAELPQPRVKSQRQLPASIRKALAERATALGLFEAA